MMKDSHNRLDFVSRMRLKLQSFKLPPRLVFIILGIASTLWFLVRVIPKPQRAGYPCMRAAAPIMSGFVLYLLSLGGMTLMFKKAVAKFKKAQYLSAVFALFISFILLVAFNWQSAQKVYSQAIGFTRGVLPDGVNNPMGEGIGVNPGRVVWVWNPAATNENCKNTVALTSSWNGVMDWDKSDAFFMPKNNNQDTINKMADDAIKALAGQSTVKDAWDAIFKNFNERKTGSASSYVAGQKIFIKVNNGQAGWAINRTDLSEKGNNSSTGVQDAAMSNTTPATVVAILRQLIEECNIAQTDIYVGEPMTHVYKSLYDAIRTEFANVIVLDKEDRSDVGRTQTSGWSPSNAIYYSDKGSSMPDGIKDVFMNEMYNADYLINIPALKAHARNGVTLTAKNHFGSHGDHGGNDWGSFDLHAGLICTVDNDVFTSGVRGNYGMYRVMTDLMGHDKLGGNTVLFVVDGLWSGIEATDMPVKWGIAPFNNDFPNSLFISQDAVAVESVCLDFLRAEADKNTYFKDRPFFPAVDDHLHQAAEKANWPSGLKYDPENDGTEMPSMGVHEHWNNSTNKQYSRNLFSNGTGIDLVAIPSTLVNHESTVANLLTISITSSGLPLEDAIIDINGSKHRSNSEGIVVIGNMIDANDLNYTVQKQGYNTFNGQVAISGDTQVNVELEGISNIGTTNSNKSFSVYPNPCSENTNLSFSLNANSTVSISLYSVDGKLHSLINNKMFAAGDHTYTVNTSNLEKGVYVCNIKIDSGTDSNMQTLKLVVQ